MAAVEAGGDAARISGARLEVENVQARRAAAYARAAGRRVGQVVRITESGGDAPPPEHFQAAAKAGDVPIQPGTAEVSVTVTVVFALD